MAMAATSCGIKLGLEFFCTHGPQGITAILESAPDLPLFLDLKLHDIPNTVAGAVRSATRLSPTYMTIHAGGGIDMMKAAQESAADEAAHLGITAPSLLAVTVLTSISQEALEQTGIVKDIDDHVRDLAGLALQSGISGVVCSPMEVRTLRKHFGSSPVLMVPGIRPAGAGRQDQKRVMTPADAIRAGATHLVIGRPITGAKDPAQAAADILGMLPETETV